MTYEEKLKIADDYLGKIANISWNTLADINSLHNADTEEEIIDMCNDRLEEEGFPPDLMED